jgi:long-chain acyl-CoA synthetase
MNLAELVVASAERTPDALAVTVGERSLTYREFVAEGSRIATGLTRAGVGRGDRVMLFADNCIEYLVLYHATVRVGAIFVPTHASFQSSELQYVVDNCEPSAVIASDHLWERLERSGVDLPELRITLDPTNRGDRLRLDELGGGAPDTPIVDVDASSPALICYTSGTTDRPHPVTRSHATEIFNAETYSQVWDYQADDRALVALPLSWVYGLTTLSQGLLATGAQIVLHASFDAQDALDEIESSGITLLAGTMSMYVAILHALQQHDADLSSLRHLYRGGEPANLHVVDALERRIGVRLCDGYALTEVAPVLAVDPVRDRDAPAGTAGRLVPGAQIRVVDALGFDVQEGEVGEAWLGGPGLMSGYWNEPELTAERVHPDGWFRTGDLLRSGSDGYYFVMGRSTDMIIRDGARVAPAEVEAALMSLPGVAEAAAVGIPDDDFGESIAAFVVVEPDCIVSVDDIYVHLGERIARYKIPTDIVFVAELPRRANSKLDRRALRTSAVDLVGSPELAS